MSLRNLVLALSLTLTAQMALAADAPIGDRPYRVGIFVSFSANPDFDLSYRNESVDSLANEITRSAGEMWNCRVVEELGSVFSGPSGLKRLRAEKLTAMSNLQDFDKCFFLAVDAVGEGCRCSGREWDAPTRQLGATLVRSSFDRREVSTVLSKLIYELFRPIAEIVQPKPGRVVIKAQGANLRPLDTNWSPLSSELIYEPFHFVLNKDLEIDRIIPIPWTYIVSGSPIDVGQTEGAVITGLRSPLPSKKHRQYALGLAIRNRSGSTRLTLTTRPPFRKPLAGIEVELSTRPTSRQVENESAENDALQAAKLPMLMTDRSGTIHLSADHAAEQYPIWLFVRSSSVLLARVPYLPGLRQFETIEVPDDSLRLDVEGDIALLQAKLVDTVARRAVLMAQAKGSAKADQFEAAQAKIQSLETMPKAPVFIEELNVIRVARTKTARAHRDKSTEERIRKLCLDTGELISNYLDESKLTELREEISELKKVFDDNNAAEAKAQAAELQAKKQPRADAPVTPKADDIGKTPQSPPGANPQDRSLPPGAPGGAPPGAPRGTMPGRP